MKIILDYIIRQVNYLIISFYVKFILITKNPELRLKQLIGSI